jgi:two-component system NarL family response regulator
VLIANDDTAARARVRAAARAADLRICGYASSADDAVSRAIRTRPDICLLDLDLPGGGLRAAAEIARTLPTASVVVLSAFATAGESWVAAGAADLALSS